MINREYKLNNPAEVRALINMGNNDLNVALGLVYAHNAKVSEIAYLQRKQRSRGFQLWEENQLGLYIESKYTLRNQLKQVLALYRMRISYGTGGRIESLIFRKTRRRDPRPTGGITYVSQEALFPFSDMYSQERFTEWLVNRTIMAETT